MAQIGRCDQMPLTPNWPWAINEVPPVSRRASAAPEKRRQLSRSLFPNFLHPRPVACSQPMTTKNRTRHSRITENPFPAEASELVRQNRRGFRWFFAAGFRRPPWNDGRSRRCR